MSIEIKRPINLSPALQEIHQKRDDYFGEIKVNPGFYGEGNFFGDVKINENVVGGGRR